jgi:hypothetical protein
MNIVGLSKGQSTLLLTALLAALLVMAACVVPASPVAPVPTPTVEPTAEATAVDAAAGGAAMSAKGLPTSVMPDLLGPMTTVTIGEPMKTKPSEQTEPATDKPAYVTALEVAYGAPSQAGFGSAVFCEQLKPTDKLEEAALAKYKYFVGGLWERYGADAWMGPWKEVYVRPTGAKPDIVAELRGIKDADAQLSAPMVLDEIEGADKARAALAAAYDDPAVTELRAFNLGDGSAMSGLLVAGRRGATGEATFLVFLLD